MKLKRNQVVLIAGIVCFFVPVSAVYFYFLSTEHPPEDARFIRNFNIHRAEFERLRTMLQEDTQLVTVADWGVRMRHPNDSLPASRYSEYMRLLGQVDSTLADRSEGEHAEPSIMLWGWGWAGHTKHLGLCWLDQTPTNLVATFDSYEGRSWYGHPFIMYRHVETNWYLWTDL